MQLIFDDYIVQIKLSPFKSLFYIIKLINWPVNLFVT
jgi:hypothetical protein